MKILLRKYGDEYYVWKTATFSNGEYYIDSERVRQIEILAVKDANANEYVICKNCGEKILNNPESIEQHYAERERQKNCLTCKRAMPYNIGMKERTFVSDENGNYHVVEKYTANLRCQSSYADINSESSALHCDFMQCRHMGVKPFGDMLMQYPDMFETQITVDALQKKGYQHVGLTLERSGDYFKYDMKSRGTVWACVNECGIVDHFACSYKYNVFYVYYSEKYNKLFFNRNGKYDENRPYTLSDAKYNFLMTKIPELYKEAKANE